MDIKDIILVGLAILGWIWGVIQFFINRRNQKRDKAIEKRFEIYSGFMKKADEIMQNLRTDPTMIYGITNDFMQKVLSGDEATINQALLDYNTELIEFTKRATQPLHIMTAELNNLRLVCSDDLLPKIDSYKNLSLDYINEFQIVLNSISKSKDINQTIKQLETIGHDKRGLEMGQLYQDIQTMMRKEIGYYNKN